MKVTVVPAQVTTVEDRISGNFSVSQIALLAIPIFGGSLLYVTLPPSMEFSLYKFLAIGFVTVLSGFLAIRIKGKIVLMWTITLLRYKLRPRRYVFTKNSTHYREKHLSLPKKSETSAPLKADTPTALPKLSNQERAYVYATFNDPVSRLRFETTKRGGLNVHLAKNKE